MFGNVGFPGGIDEMTDQQAIAAAFDDKTARRYDKIGGQALLDRGRQSRDILKQAQQKGFGGAIAAPQSITEASLKDLRDVRTELRESVPSKETPDASRLDKVYQTIYSKLTEMRDSKIAGVGRDERRYCPSSFG